MDEDKELVALWAMRGSPFVIATADLPIFTRPLLPDDELATLCLFIGGRAAWQAQLNGSGVTARDLVEHLTRRMHKVLDGRILTKEALGRALVGGVPKALQLHFPNEAALSFLTLTAARLVAHTGVYLIAPRVGDKIQFVRTDQWLKRRPPPFSMDKARAELVRRFLRAFGPARPEDLSWWAATHTDKATRLAHEQWAKSTWKYVEGELEEVVIEDGSHAFVLASDLKRLMSPPEVGEVRLIPPHDPFRMARDRGILVPEEALHRRLWRTINNPGIVLAGTECVAIWRPRKRGRRLAVGIEALRGRLPRRTRLAVEDEALRIAPLRGCDQVELHFVE